MPAADHGGPAGHIVIIGAMGSGKTNLGRRLAAGLHRAFFDSDITIQANTGQSGREIAESEGVTVLHRMEREALTEALSGQEPAVIAAASSVVDDPETRADLEEVFCVWVRADPRILAERASKGTHRRAVARSEHLERRNSVYARLADLAVDTGVSSPDETAGRVLAEILGRRDE